MKTTNLRWRGRQWQFIKRLPADISGQLGKVFYVQNLGTSDVLEAARRRDRLLIELGDVVCAARGGEVDRRASVLSDIWGIVQLDLNRSDVAVQKVGVGRDNLDGDVACQVRASVREVSVTKHVDRFLRECPGVHTTQAARRSSIVRFEAWLKQGSGRPSIEAVDKRVAGNFASHLSGQGLAQATVNSQLSYLSSYWRFLVKRGLAEQNPFQGQQSSTKGSSKPRLEWTMPEVGSLIEKAPTRLLKHAIAIAALSGLRAGELAALKARDCKDGVFNIRAGKTDAAIRKVPIHSNLGALIESRISRKDDQDYLLHEVKGSAKGIVKRFARYRARLLGKAHGQAEKTFHSLRHSFVTEALRAGRDLYVVQSCVGHVPQGVTLGVYHKGPSLEQLRDVVESMKLPFADRSQIATKPP